MWRFVFPTRLFGRPRSATFISVLGTRTNRVDTQKSSWNACAFFARGDPNSSSSALRSPIGSMRGRGTSRMCGSLLYNCRNPCLHKGPEHLNILPHSLNTRPPSFYVRPQRPENRYRFMTFSCAASLSIRSIPSDVFVPQELDLTFVVNLGTASFPTS